MCGVVVGTYPTLFIPGSVSIGVRAITSDCVNFCKIEKGSLFTHFGPKNTHINGCKIVHLCTIAIVAVHICMVTVALLFIILYFFFSPLSSDYLSSLI